MKEKLSIIVPVFNEEKTIRKVLESLLKVKMPVEKEIVVVNDGSTDNSLKIIQEIAGKNNSVKVFSKENGGKGSAVKLGIEKASGTVLIFQDADLEYNPKEIPEIIRPVLNGKAKVVFGSRFKGKIIGKIMWSHQLGNNLLSLATSILFFKKISDMETGYKAFRKEILQGIKLNSKSFDMEPEITAKILKRGIKILEVPISYKARTFAEGKKITLKDGIVALKTLIKYRFFD